MSDTSILYSKNRVDKTKGTRVFIGTSTSTASPIRGVTETVVDSDAVKQKHTVSPDVENAIYAHIRALRALGKTRVNTADIAMALHLPQKTVDMAIANLKDKGVKKVS